MLTKMIHKNTPLSVISTSKFELMFQAEIKGLSNVEKVLLETADGVMETKRKLEFGVQQIIFKVVTF